MKDLTVIIISYNTAETTKNTIESLLTSLQKPNINSTFEIIVLDNNSSDNSVELLKELKSKNKSITLIESKENLGFAKGNNRALEKATGKYVLYLNSDVIISDVDFDGVIDKMDTHKDIGVYTVRVNLPNGKIDPASHRGFPTVWRSFCYYSGLENTVGKVPIIGKYFGGYHLVGSNMTSAHDIDSPSGVFFLTRKELLDKLGGFDEDFFMYGEDIDLAFRIKELGYSIVYDPEYDVTHLKYSSGLKNTDKVVQKKIKNTFYDAMKIFYRKHYMDKYPSFITKLVFFFVDFKKLV